MEKEVEKNIRGDTVRKRALFIWWGMVVFSEVLAGIYTVLSIFSIVPFNIAILFGWLSFLLLVNSVLFYTAYRNRKKISIWSKIILALWSSVVLWFWAFSPVFYVISTNFTQAQLKVAAFTYFWEVPVIGGLYIVFCQLYFIPMYRFLTGKKSRIKNPQEAYDFLHKFAYRAGVILAFFATVGFVIGAFQQGFFSQLPIFEQIKLIFHGIILSFLSGLYVMIILDSVFNGFRNKIRTENPSQTFVVGGFSQKIFRANLILTIASIGIMLVIGVKISQNIIKDTISQTVSSSFEDVFAYFGTNTSIHGKVQISSLQEHFGGKLEVFIYNKSALREDFFAPETISYIKSHKNGEIEDNRRELKMIIFRTDPNTFAKAFVIVYLTDHYAPIYKYSVIAVFASILVIIFASLLMFLFTKTVSGSLASIKNAIKKGGEDILSLKLSTGDEFEELADNLSLYAVQARDASLGLENKVEEKTHDLNKKIEELQKSNDSLENMDKAMINILEDAKELEVELGEQRDRAGAIVTSIGEGLLVIDKDQKVILINPAAEKLLEIKADEIQGKDVKEVVSVLHNGEKLNDDQRPGVITLETGKSVYWNTEDNYSFQLKSGRVIPVSLSTTLLSTTTTTTNGLVEVFRDVSAEKQLEQNLVNEKAEIEKKVEEQTKLVGEEKARLLASINSISMGFIMLDSIGKVLFVNPAFGKITGEKTALEDINSIDALLCQNFALKQKFEKCMSQKQQVEENDINLNEKYYHLYMAPIFSTDNTYSLIGVVAMIEDETEAKVLARSRDEFFSIASHELRTPLTAIKGNTSLIQEYYGDKLQDKDLKEMINDIHESSTRLIGIVNDFLNVSRLEQGRMEFKKEVFDIVPIIEKIVYEVGVSAKEKNLYIKFDEVAGAHPMVLADSARTKEIIYNLLGNVMKFTEKGGATITIEEKDNFMNVYVSDTGKGIPLTSQPLLFRKFQQAENNILTRDNTQGTGLGLYISKLMAKGMGGDLVLEKSEENKGSTFLVTLPLAKDTDKQALENAVKEPAGTNPTAEVAAEAKPEVKTGPAVEEKPAGVEKTKEPEVKKDGKTKS